MRNVLTRLSFSPFFQKSEEFNVLFYMVSTEKEKVTCEFLRRMFPEGVSCNLGEDVSLKEAADAFEIKLRSS